MTEEGLDAAVYKLQALVLETYGKIKDIYRHKQEDGHVDEIANLSLQLANFEGALLTLRSYKQDIINSVNVVVESDGDVEDEISEEQVEEQVEEDKEDGVITEKELAKKSQSFRDSQKYRKKKAKK